MKNLVVIGMPCSPSCKADVFTTMFCVLQGLQKNRIWKTAFSSYVDIGRNKIISEALENPKVTHIFFVDWDTRPPMDTIDKLLALDTDVAAGVYPFFLDGRFVWSAAQRDDFEEGAFWETPKTLPEKAFQAQAVGGSTILVKREVFEQVGWPWFEVTYKTNKAGVQQPLGEDVNFSRKVRHAGFDIWVDPSIKCGHYKYNNLMDFIEKGFS